MFIRYTCYTLGAWLGLAGLAGLARRGRGRGRGVGVGALLDVHDLDDLSDKR